MGTVSAFGRDFNFGDDVAPDVAQQRIQNWMRMHAPDELGSATVPSGPAATPAAAVAPAAASNSPGLLGRIKQTLEDMGTRHQQARQAAAGDTINFARTLAQGAFPAADEAIAGIRSLVGTPYDQALTEERQGLKDYGEKYGEGAKLATELGGAGLGAIATLGVGPALAGTRAGMAVGRGAAALPGAAKMAELAAKYPKIAAALSAAGTGAAIGGAGGFAAGEGDFGSRMENAGPMAVVGGGLGLGGLGAVKTVESLGNLFGKNNKVAEYLRRGLPQDRGEAYKNMPGMLDKEGNLNIADPTVINRATDELSNDLARQRGLSQATARGARGTDVITADSLPGMLETTLQQPGTDTSNLARQIAKRQFDPTLPLDQQEAASQFGHAGKWFDRMFGNSNFRGTEEQLLATRKAAADAGFAPAFQKNVRGPEIEDALNDPFVSKAWKAAKEKMEAERKPLGTVNPVTNNITDYNTEFLHKVKTTMDDMITAARKQPEGTTGADTARVIGTSKNRLNEAIMNQNPEYKAAMKEFGDHSDLIDALRQGREGVFGKNVNELDKGVGAEDIAAFLRDPNKSNAEKDLYRVGAARALRSNLLGSDAKTFTSNWADVLNKPNMVAKYKALQDPAKLGSWDMMVGQARQLSDRNKAMGKALGNSATAKRLQSQEDLSQPNMLANLVATTVNPTAPSGWRHWVQTITNPTANKRIVANETAKILGGVGRAGNQDSVSAIRDILTQYRDRGARFDRAKGLASTVAPYAWPYRDRGGE